MSVQEWLRTSNGWESRGRLIRTVNSRSSLVYGTYLPDSSTTGIMSAPTTTITTNSTYSDTSGTIKLIEDTEFQGHVYVTGKNYTFRNCFFSGPVAGITDSIVQLRYASSSGNRFEDCTFCPQTATNGVNCLQGRGFVALRCNVYGSIDGIDPAPADTDTRVDVEIQQCYIHDLVRYCPYAGQSDNQTHTDAIQWMGGLGLTLRGNRIENLLDTVKGTGWSAPTYDGNSVLTGGHSFYPSHPVGTAAVMINALNNVIQPGELIMQKNWIRGGAVGINSLGVALAWNSNDGITDISDNWILNDQGFGTNNRWVGKASQTGLSFGTNYLWNTSSPLDTSTILSTFKVNA